MSTATLLHAASRVAGGPGAQAGVPGVCRMRVGAKRGAETHPHTAPHADTFPGGGLRTRRRLNCSPKFIC